MTSAPRILRLVTIGLLFLISGCSTTEPQVAEPMTRVNFERINDEAGVLSVPEEEHLTNLLESYERVTSHQLAVLTVNSLGGDSIETYSAGTMDKLGLGIHGIDNGMLILLAPNDRKVRIEIGPGFEKYISDSRAKEIVDTEMVPAFRQQQYALGIERGLTLLMIDGRALVVSRKDN